MTDFEKAVCLKISIICVLAKILIKHTGLLISLFVWDKCHWDHASWICYMRAKRRLHKNSGLEKTSFQIFLLDTWLLRGNWWRELRGYRQRILRKWNARGMFDPTEQCVFEQAGAIRKNKSLSDIELKMIRRKAEDEMKV